MPQFFAKVMKVKMISWSFLDWRLDWWSPSWCLEDVFRLSTATWLRLGGRKRKYYPRDFFFVILKKKFETWFVPKVRHNAVRGRRWKIAVLLYLLAPGSHPTLTYLCLPEVYTSRVWEIYACVRPTWWPSCLCGRHSFYFSFFLRAHILPYIEDVQKQPWPSFLS